MAAPSVTNRTLPVGFLVPEGFKTTIAFSANASVAFWEETVKPFGEDGGDPITITNQHNVEFETMRPRKLKKLTNVTGSAFYDPDARAAIRGLINKEQAITVWNPDGSGDSFFGYLQKVDYQEYKMGEAPKLNYEVVVTNYDPSGKVEAGPVHTPSTGT